MAGTGGKRIGAGRPKGRKNDTTLEAEAGRLALIKAYMDNIGPLNDSLIEKALEGDVPAHKEIRDRVHGKSAQAVEMTGKDGTALFPESTVDVEAMAKEVAAKLREKKT